MTDEPAISPTYTAFFDVAGKCLTVIMNDRQLESWPGAVHSAAVDAGTTPNDIFWDGTGVAERQPFPITITPNRVEGIPAGTVVHFKTNTETVNDGEIEFSVVMPETLRIVLEHPHYLNDIFEVPCEA